MARGLCSNCGHNVRHSLKNGKCLVYTAGQGWCDCTGERWDVDAGVSAPALHLGKAVLRKLFEDTRAFRDKSVADADAKARKRPTLSMADRMRLQGIRRA